MLLCRGIIIKSGCGVNNTLGRLTEAMFSGQLWKRFITEGYEFTKQAPNVMFVLSDKVVAEADLFLEDGKYVMPVEVKTSLTIDDVNYHLQRIDTIRKYMDSKIDKRTIVGAVAGGTVPQNIMRYAHKNGLYVFTLSGESVMVAEAPPGFKAQEWA